MNSLKAIGAVYVCMFGSIACAKWLVGMGVSIAFKGHMQSLGGDGLSDGLALRLQKKAKNWLKAGEGGIGFTVYVERRCCSGNCL